MQSPRDDWGFYSIAMSYRGKKEGEAGILVHTDLPVMKWSNWAPPSDTNIQMSDTETILIVPWKILQFQVSQTCKKLAELMERLERLELNIAGNAEPDLATLIQQLHKCNMDSVKMKRRWTFQERVAQKLKGLISNGFPEIPLTAHYVARMIEHNLKIQMDVSAALQYDVDDLPRRISDLFTAVRVRKGSQLPHKVARKRKH